MACFRLNDPGVSVPCRAVVAEAALAGDGVAAAALGTIQPISTAATGIVARAARSHFRSRLASGWAAACDGDQTLIAQPVDAGQSVELALIENVARENLGVIEPGGIALDASFGRPE